MQSFGIERGEILLSLQLILTREEERVSVRMPADPPVRVFRPAPHRISVPQAHRPSHRTPVAPLSRPTASRGPRPSPPTAVEVMVDPATGAGTIEALRRDLALARPGPTRPGAGMLVALRIVALDQIRLVMGPEAAEAVVKTVVEVAPFALHSRDRLYRSTRDQFLVLIDGAEVAVGGTPGDEASGDEAPVEAARRALETAAGRLLADRGLPEVRLEARQVDPAKLAG